MISSLSLKICTWRLLVRTLKEWDALELRLDIAPCVIIVILIFVFIFDLFKCWKSVRADAILKVSSDTEILWTCALQNTDTAGDSHDFRTSWNVLKPRGLDPMVAAPELALAVQIDFFLFLKPGNSFYIISPHCCIPKIYPSPALSCVVSESFMISLCNSRHRIRLWSKVMRTIQREALPGTVEVRDHKTHHADSKIGFNTAIYENGRNDKDNYI